MKRSRIRRVSNSPKRKLEIECDRMFSLLVKVMFKRFCCMCGRFGDDPHHLIKRSTSSMPRHETMNGLLLCRICHNFVEANPDHADRWLEMSYPEHHKYVHAFHRRPITPVTEFTLSERLEDMKFEIWLANEVNQLP